MSSKLVGSRPGAAQKSNTVIAEVEPFTKSDRFSFVRLKVTEVLYGDMSYGEILLHANDGAKEEVFMKKNAIHVIIKQEEVYQKQFDLFGYIIHKDFNREQGDLNMTFVCVPRLGTKCPKDFFSKTRYRKFEKMNIKDVMDSVWNADESHRPIRWETDGTDLPVMDWFQDQETDQQFLTRLAFSFRKQTVFSFDFDGMFVKDIIWKDRVYGTKEPYRVVTGLEAFTTDGTVNLNYQHNSYKKILNPCLEKVNEQNNLEPPGREISKNFDLEFLDENIRPYHKDYRKAQEYYRYNTRNAESMMFSVVTARYTDNLPPLRVGDTVVYGKVNEKKPQKGPNGDITTYLVTQVSLYFSIDPNQKDAAGQTFSSEITLHGLEDYYGNFMPDTPEQDPGEIDDTFAL